MTTRVRVLTRNASRALSRRRAQTSQKQKCSSSGSKLRATGTRAKLLQQQRQRSAAITAAAAAANGSNEVTKSSTTTATRHAQPPGEVLRVTAHAVRTPVGVFSVCVDDAGAVRLCNWLPSHTRDSVQAALAEVYKGYTLDVHIVTESNSSSSGDDDTMTNAQQQQHTPEAVQLLQAYFDTAPSLSRGNSSAADVSALNALLSRVAVVLPPHATSFTTAVWQTLRQSVAAGEVVTYKQLGERVVTQQQQQQLQHKNMVATTTAASGRTHYARAVGRAMATNPIVVVVPCHRVLASSHTLHGYSCGLHRKVWLLQHEHAAGVSACELQRWQGVQRPYAQQ